MAGAMQFWGAEVKAKLSHKENLLPGSIIHVSQVTLGEAKKDKETVTVHVKVGNTKLVMGLLSQETPQLSCDLVFDDDVEFSHNWKNGSIHLMGYKAETGEQALDFDSEEEEEDVPVAKENGQISAAVAKPKVDNKPNPELKAAIDEDESSDDEDFEEGDSDDTMGISDSDDEDDDDESDSEEETPVAVAPSASKKRGNAPAKLPEPKKAKIVATPSKTDGKKGAAHPATPHPKKEGKTPAGNKSEAKAAPHTATPHPKKGGNTPAAEKSPKSAGSVACSSCKKTFKSDVGLQSHTKDKHPTPA